MKRMPLLLLAVLLTGAFCLPCRGAENYRTVHVVVALCDNENQRIAPVPQKLGDGKDPQGNLYWGAAYGVKTFMRKQPGWFTVARADAPERYVLERLILRNDALRVTMIADAYQGDAIKEGTVAFLAYAAGKEKKALLADGEKIPAGGDAELVVYMGHNGLMDFSIFFLPKAADKKKRPAAIFACQSKAYFEKALQNAGAAPLLWTRGNMAPEAYVLAALVESWARGATGEEVREAVAKSYDKYQKCGIKGARGLFATGW